MTLRDRAVAVETTSAIVASAAGEVDFADNPFIDQLRWPFNDRSDELVSRNTLEVHVAFKNLEIGGADAGKVNFDQSSVIVRLGL